MAEVRIGELPAASEIKDGTLIPVEQDDGTPMHISGSLISSFVQSIIGESGGGSDGGDDSGGGTGTTTQSEAMTYLVSTPVEQSDGSWVFTLTAPSNLTNADQIKALHLNLLPSSPNSGYQSAGALPDPENYHLMSLTSARVGGAYYEHRVTMETYGGATALNIGPLFYLREDEFPSDSYYVKTSVVGGALLLTIDSGWHSPFNQSYSVVVHYTY